MQDVESSSSCTCLCGRSFTQPSALSKHKRACPKSKKRLSGALGKAKQLWVGRKRQRLGHAPEDPQSPPPGLIRAPSPMVEDPIEVCDDDFMYSESQNAQLTLTFAVLQPMVADVIQPDDAHLTMMERMPWTRRPDRQPPRRFRDVLPQPLVPLASANITPSNAFSDVQSLSTSAVAEPEGTGPSSIAQVGSRIRRILTTPWNLFGLSRTYHATDIPSYDPEEQVSMHDLSNIPSHSNHPDSTSLFHPYPNHNAFRLGDWFWNGGVQKSQASFNELMDIIDGPDFKLEDVRDIKWDQINKKLGAEDEGEWMDEDAGWTHTPVTVSVPFQLRRGVPTEPHDGPRNYVVREFYHRNLVSVIREKLSGLNDCHLFHFEPYELNWQQATTQDPVRVYGELYTSPAFISAHQDLQDSPGEPGCDLPRVVAALMFWSDVTHLTAFGNAKLWPLYMFFGNESKYRRCRPSCHLCEHVAYFQTVSVLLP